MTLPEQNPMSKRRLRGTRFYYLRNYYALAAIGGFCSISVPIFFFSNFRKNFEATYERFAGTSEYIETKKYYLMKNLKNSSKDLATREFQIGVESGEYADLTQYDRILKDDKPGFDDA